MVMELIEHGNLMQVHEKIVKNNWTFTEKDAAKLIKQILMALNYMHKQGIVHRDLKMENVMVDLETTPSGETEIICKLADFGFATVLEEGHGTRGFMGTPFYMAPEIINRQVYTNKVDLWALGVLAYVLLSGGNFPFRGRTDRILFNQIKSHRVNLSYFERYTNSEVLCDFVMHCLDRDP